MPPVPKAKGAKGKPKGTKQVPDGLNRDGKPWKRGPYKGGPNNRLTDAVKRLTETTVTVDDYVKQVAVLNGQVKQLTEDNADLRAQLKAAAKTAGLELQIAVQKAQLSASEKVFNKYSQGVAMGMGRVQVPSGGMEPPAAPMFTPFSRSGVPAYSGMAE